MKTIERKIEKKNHSKSKNPNLFGEWESTKNSYVFCGSKTTLVNLHGKYPEQFHSCEPGNHAMETVKWIKCRGKKTGIFQVPNLHSIVKLDLRKLFIVSVINKWHFFYSSVVASSHFFELKLLQFAFAFCVALHFRLSHVWTIAQRPTHWWSAIIEFAFFVVVSQ